MLNNEQQRAKDIVHNGQNAFITGKAGTGKLFTATCLGWFKKRREDQEIVSVTCRAGIAGKSLPLGLQATTLHSYAGIKDDSGSLNQNNLLIIPRFIPHYCARD